MFCSISFSTDSNQANGNTINTSGPPIQFCTLKSLWLPGSESEGGHGGHRATESCSICGDAESDGVSEVAWEGSVDASCLLRSWQWSALFSLKYTPRPCINTNTLSQLSCNSHFYLFLNVILWTWNIWWASHWRDSQDYFDFMVSEILHLLSGHHGV